MWIINGVEFVMDSDRYLLILGCSMTKLQTPGVLPAVERYDGPLYRVLRSFLRKSMWPKRLSVAVLSARYGLIGGLTPIEYYNQRMDPQRAAELRVQTTNRLLGWSHYHRKASLILGKDYLPALSIESLDANGMKIEVVDGPIGIKLNRLSTILNSMYEKSVSDPVPQPNPNRLLYFLPDWDDLLDVDYDFRQDRFSNPNKQKRKEKHVVQIMQPERLCDGVLVSLAQHLGSKGALKKFTPNDLESLAPRSIREMFGVSSDQWVFGDCGAFSYVNEADPTITTEQAISLYQLYNFDFGASVDHIPVSEVLNGDGRVSLTLFERKRRIKLTRDNAGRFIELHKRKKCTFIPVGIMQGISPQDYARQLPEYIEMGYKHVAVGGLVPRTDKEIIEIVSEIYKASKQNNLRPWIHLLGIFRPQIQPHLFALGVTSFDSATYFRKAWLRSGQNYLGVDGQWYTAIRVPMTSDPRTRKRLITSGLSLQQLEQLEYTALQTLYAYGNGQSSLNETLAVVGEYDYLLNRNEAAKTNFLKAYRRTLEARPWERCNCPICSTIGIDVVIFRGYNRNKRRGAHNTFMLYKIVCRSGEL